MATVEPYLTAGGGRRYRVRYRKPDGGTTSKRGFTTKAAAEDFGNTVEVKKLSGDYIPPSAAKVKFGVVAARWERTLGHLAETTDQSIRSVYKCHVLPYWQDQGVGEPGPVDVKEWMTWMKDEGVGRATRAKAIIVARGIWSVALDERLCSRNPALGVRLGKEAGERRRRGYLSHDQVAHLSSHMPTHRDKAFTNLLAYSGARYGEAAATLQRDYALARRRVSLFESVSEPRGRIVVSTPKNGKPRTSTYTDFVAEMVERQLFRLAPDELVFTSGTGTHMRGTNWRPRVFYPAVKKCRADDPLFPDITIHDLRHTAASLAVQSGASPKTVQEMLGHASAAMTLDVYADLFDGDLDDVSRRMNEAARAAQLKWAS